MMYELLQDRDLVAIVEKSLRHRLAITGIEEDGAYYKADVASILDCSLDTLERKPGMWILYTPVRHTKETHSYVMPRQNLLVCLGDAIARDVRRRPDVQKWGIARPAATFLSERFGDFQARREHEKREWQKQWATQKIDADVITDCEKKGIADIEEIERIVNGARRDVLEHIWRESDWKALATLCERGRTLHKNEPDKFSRLINHRAKFQSWKKVKPMLEYRRAQLPRLLGAFLDEPEVEMSKSDTEWPVVLP